MATKESCIARTSDRAGGKDLVDVFSLGEIRLNAFPLPGEEDSPAYPLTLAYSPTTKLVQLRHSVDPELMFRAYWYNSGTNESMVAHLQGIVEESMKLVKLYPDDVVVDIGCNDGTLLQAYPSWVRKVGYDPSLIEPEGLDLFINDFFKAAPFAGNKKAKIVSSIAMFYDVEDPIQFAREVREILDDDGIWVIEMHYLPVMLEKNEVDAICHEHLCYYSLESLQNVLREAGMSVVEISFNHVNGGSMRAYAKKAGRASAPSPMMHNVLAQEQREPWMDRLMRFAKNVEQNKITLPGLLWDVRGKVLGYGASTKGNTLLQYANLDSSLLPAIADRNPTKWGRQMVGTRIPIISENEMRERDPEYLLALPYHFIDNFRQREKESIKWIVPVPSPAVI